MTRSDMLRAGAMTLLCVLATAGGPAQASERLPDAVREALAKEPRYRGDRVESIFTRRPAPTAAGFMYEVVLMGEQGERLVYVDPDKALVIFFTGANRGN